MPLGEAGPPNHWGPGTNSSCLLPGRQLCLRLLLSVRYGFWAASTGKSLKTCSGLPEQSRLEAFAGPRNNLQPRAGGSPAPSPLR